MVFFTCSACGASLKKNQVDKHCNNRCRQCEYITCIDCLKDFPGDTYKAHTKCITENERYGGLNYVPKVNKNENKQLQWVENIQNLLTTTPDMDPDIKGLLHTIMDHENIPRKKSKFINFMRNVNKRVHPKTIDKTWEFFERALKSNKPSKEVKNGTDKKESLEKEEASSLKDPSNKDIKKKKKNEKDLKNEDDSKKGKKKKKQSKKESGSEVENEEPPKKSNKKNRTLNEFKGTDNSSKKRKYEEINQEKDEDSHPGKVGKFDWEGTITTLLVKKEGSISLKKLKKKILAEYESQCGVTHKTQEDLLSKMNKKISKNKRFKVQKDQVILVS